MTTIPKAVTDHLKTHHMGWLALLGAAIASVVLHHEIQSKPYTEVKAQKEIVEPAQVAPPNATAWQTPSCHIGLPHQENSAFLVKHQTRHPEHSRIGQGLGGQKQAGGNAGHAVARIHCSNVNS